MPHITVCKLKWEVLNTKVMRENEIFFWLQKELVCFRTHHYAQFLYQESVNQNQENTLSVMDNDSGRK